MHDVVRRRLSLLQLQLTGMACTAALSAGGVGVGAVPKAGAKDAIANLLHLTGLRDHAALRGLCNVLVFLALSLLLVCWWQLRRRLPDLLPREVVVTAALWALPLLVAPPLFSADIYAYAGQGHLVAHDIDPYLYGPGALEPTSKWSYNIDGLWRFSPSPYGPVWLWVTGLAVRLSHGHLIVTLYLIRALAVLGLALVAVSLPVLSRAAGVAPQQALWLAIANPLVLIHGVAGAHNDVLMLGLLCGGLAIAVHRPATRGLVAASFVITLAALVKLPAVLGLAFLPLLVSGVGARLRATAVCLAAAGATALVAARATSLGWGWVHVLRSADARPSVWSLVSGAGAVADWVSEHSGGPHDHAVGTAVESAGPVLAASLALALWIAASRGANPVRCLGGALLAVFALSPDVQPWYLFWGLVLLATTERQALRTVLAVLATTLCLCLLPGGRSWVKPPLYGLPVLAALLAAAGLLWSRAASQRTRLWWS